jgi:hypothetical protein
MLCASSCVGARITAREAAARGGKDLAYRSSPHKNGLGALRTDTHSKTHDLALAASSHFNIKRQRCKPVAEPIAHLLSVRAPGLPTPSQVRVLVAAPRLGSCEHGSSQLPA